jgi:hypothetical protein
MALSRPVNILADFLPSDPPIMSLHAGASKQHKSEISINFWLLTQSLRLEPGSAGA